MADCVLKTSDLVILASHVGSVAGDLFVHWSILFTTIYLVCPLHLTVVVTAGNTHWSLSVIRCVNEHSSP